MVFQQRWGLGPDGRKVKHYYAPESAGIATGFLIAALHQAGLATLTHTSARMGFLNEICGRPDNEKPIVLLVGHPAEGCRVQPKARDAGRAPPGLSKQKARPVHPKKDARAAEAFAKRGFSMP